MKLQPAAGLALSLVVAGGSLRVSRSRYGPLEPLRPVGVVRGAAGAKHLGFVSHSVAALHQRLVRGQQIEDAVSPVRPVLALVKSLVQKLILNARPLE